MSRGKLSAGTRSHRTSNKICRQKCQLSGALECFCSKNFEQKLWNVRLFLCETFWIIAENHRELITAPPPGFHSYTSSTSSTMSIGREDALKPLEEAAQPGRSGLYESCNGELPGIHFKQKKCFKYRVIEKKNRNKQEEAQSEVKLTVLWWIWSKRCVRYCLAKRFNHMIISLKLNDLSDKLNKCV